MELPLHEHQLRSYLAALSTDRAVALAATVERDRLRARMGLPAEFILDELRPLIRSSKLARLPTPQRLFCMPFEDFLVDEPRAYKQPGRIARSSVTALWRWLVSEARLATLGDLEARISRATLAADAAREAELVAVLQQQVARAVREALQDAGSAERRHLAAGLGGEERLLDAEEIGLLAQAGGELAAFAEALPKRIDSLTDEHAAAARSAYHRVSRRQPELGPYVGLLLLARLRRPWEALRLAGMGSRRSSEILASLADMSVVGDVLLADLDELAREIATVKPAALETGALIALLERFNTMATGLVREVGLRRDGKWGQRLIKTRQIASDALNDLIAHAPHEIIAALPLHKAGAFGGRRPDFSRDPDAPTFERALAWATLLAGSARFAGGCAFHAAHREAFDQVSEHLRQYADGFIAELRSLDGKRRLRADAYLMHAEALGDVILGPEETNLMRRRAAIALSR